jgi:hypothetical protein
MLLDVSGYVLFSLMMIYATRFLVDNTYSF